MIQRAPTRHRNPTWDDIEFTGRDDFLIVNDPMCRRRRFEVRGTAGPCNVQSVGFKNASQAILLAAYRALLLLSPCHLPPGFVIPLLPHQSVSSPAGHNSHPSTGGPSTPYTSRTPSPSPGGPLPPITVPIFKAAWLGLAGVNTPSDVKAFASYPPQILCLSPEKITITNDVNLLAAPALKIPDVDHVVTVVCGTGTVGRTLRIGGATDHGLPLVDVAVSRGWGYLLCDEGSAFWIGRLAIRNLLMHADQRASIQVYSEPPPPLLPFHQDLLDYFNVEDPMDLIEVVSHTDRWIGPGASDPGQVASRRNAMLAGAARIVLRWAFSNDHSPQPDRYETEGQLPTPPDSKASTPSPSSKKTDGASSRLEALRLAKMAIRPMVDLTMALLGDRTKVRPERSVLSLGGGLMMSKGYRDMLLEGLKKEGVEWRFVQVVSDAAGAGASGLAAIEFASDGGKGAKTVHQRQ